MTIRALIVDDEPLAREGLRGFLEGHRDVDVVGECGDGESAVRAISAQRPNLVFLDIQMPELSGFQVLERLTAPLPVIVFVTAYDRYALDAFEAHAVDYLLKPLSEERFEKALARARAQLAYDRGADVADRVAEMLAGFSGGRTYPVRLTIRSGGSVTFVRVDEIDWVEAAGNYVRLHVGADQHLLRQTMSALERDLDPERFARVHRSAIVNLDRVREIQPWFKGDQLILLDNGARVTMSRTYRGRLLGS